ncbi:helix-turn-helix domain-containing protein [Sphingobium limneticum]|uniref:helix-turn-helix domain-containing protein n=1 Tax=Sphingobium limneticum TaxID=1007511 RepID=UPI003D05896C
MCELFGMSEPSSIKDLRAALGLTLVEFGERIGLSSKGQVSIIERENKCGLRVALAIETLSGGRINAAALCEEVRLARETVHDGSNAAAQHGPSPDTSSENVGEAA